ncbi:MAG TPA: hypothetical protein VD962_11220 [Rubricoccaceae bacterium]|nr:hypothetical protein [Rubricoccaceae bacterium]
MLRPLAAALPVVPALLFALALRDGGTPDESPASPEARSVLVSLGPESVRHRASDPSGVSCSLPLGRQIGAARAFAEMVPVFRHPRCFNCHGNYDILSEAHPGDIDSRRAVDAVGRNPLRDLLTVEERLRFHSECRTCHNNISGRGVRPAAEDSARSVSGWMLAPLPMQWVGKDDEELCMLVKRFESNGNQFIDHVLRDHAEVQFVEVAFRGDRALGFGRDGLESFNLTAEPPPGTAEELVAQARRWVRLMGAEEEWVGDPSCGCVMPEIELAVRIEVVINAEATISGRMTATVPLTADTSGQVFGGEAPLRPSDFVLPPVPPGCNARATYTDGAFVVREAHLDATDDGDLTVDLRVQATPSGGTMEVSCPNMPRPLAIPLGMISDQWVAVNSLDRTTPDYRFTEFETPGSAPSENGRTLLARKEVTRTVQADNGDVTVRTLFELWSRSDAP